MGTHERREKIRRKRPEPARTSPPNTGWLATLAARGIRVSPQGFAGMVAEAVAEFPRAQASARTETELTAFELAALRRGGLDPRARDLRGEDPLALTAAGFTALIASSRSVAEVARLLGVNESRVRQRLNSPTPSLYGFKVEAEWRIPSFVFEGQRLIPGIAMVAERLDPGVHPVTFFRWFTQPDADLVQPGDPEDTPQVPRTWLLAGHAPEAVAELAGRL